MLVIKVKLITNTDGKSHKRNWKAVAVAVYLDLQKTPYMHLPVFQEISLKIINQVLATSSYALSCLLAFTQLRNLANQVMADFGGQSRYGLGLVVAKASKKKLSNTDN